MFIGPLGTYFIEIWINIKQFSFMIMNLKMLFVNVGISLLNRAPLWYSTVSNLHHNRIGNLWAHHQSKSSQWYWYQNSVKWLKNVVHHKQQVYTGLIVLACRILTHHVHDLMSQIANEGYFTYCILTLFHAFIFQIDNVEKPSWQAQVTGHKLLTIEAPPECYHVCEQNLEVIIKPGEICKYNFHLSYLMLCSQVLL